MSQRNWKASHRIRRRGENTSVSSGGTEFSTPLIITPIDENKASHYHSESPSEIGSVGTADSYDKFFTISSSKSTGSGLSSRPHHHGGSLASIAESSAATSRSGVSMASTDYSSVHTGEYSNYSSVQSDYSDYSNRSDCTGYSDMSYSAMSGGTSAVSNSSDFIENFISSLRASSSSSSDENKSRYENVGGFVGCVQRIYHKPPVQVILRYLSKQAKKLSPTMPSSSGGDTGGGRTPLSKRKSSHKFWYFVKVFWLVCLLLTLIATFNRSGQIASSSSSDKHFHRKREEYTPFRGSQDVHVVSASHVGMKIPAVYNHLSDVDEPFELERHLPFFWHIPRAAGTTVNDVLGSCVGLNLAGDAGGQNGRNREELKVIPLGKHNINYVNVDTSTLEGIKRAREQKLVPSQLANALLCSRIYEATDILFLPSHNGKLFTFFRHPVERAVSLFHYTQDTVWRRRQTPELNNIKIDDYFKASMGENNWVVRFLTHERTKMLTENDLNVAKEVLRRKCLVGLLKYKSESMERFMKYFRWNVNGEEGADCLDKNLSWAWPLKHRHDEVEEGSDVWNSIMKMNEWDMKLYEYAKVLFREQERLFR